MHGYILATGEPEVERLGLLNRMFGPSSEALLKWAGLVEGMRVAEIGCGTGNMTCWLARQVGSAGHVTALDRSPEQIDVARRTVAAAGLGNVALLVADAYEPGLPEGTFDLAYCRLVLMHLQRPLDALLRMKALLRPGGVLVCEEFDVGYFVCEPPSAAVRRFMELNLAASDHRGQHFRIGTRLPEWFRRAGFARPEASVHQSAVLRGPEKRVMPLSFRQFVPNLLADGLIAPDEVEAVGRELDQVAADETTLLGMPLMGQVWARL